ALVAAALPRGVQVAGLGLVALLADAGLAAAVWQHFVAAEQASCSMTLADRIVGTLGLDERWPQVFMATATCAEAKVKLMGMPYEFWSGLLFGLIGLYAPWRVAFAFAKARR
ncbi:MAG: disulfide bond formation protein B, partial [Rubrivivax sp.]|nr:disulfide bond formation protein B [Rubrivivax sp.]